MAATLTTVGLTIPAAHAGRPTTGVGSCTLKNWNPDTDPKNAKDLPLGHRPQTYRPDDYDCTGAVFAKPGVEFAKFPQPRDYRVTITNRDADHRTSASARPHLRQAARDGVGPGRNGQPAGARTSRRSPTSWSSTAGEPHLRRLPRRLRHHGRGRLQRRRAEHQPHKLGAQPARARQDLRAERLLQHRHAAAERPEPLVAVLRPVRLQFAAAVLPCRHRDAVRPVPRR